MSDQDGPEVVNPTAHLLPAHLSAADEQALDAIERHRRSAAVIALREFADWVVGAGYVMPLAPSTFAAMVRERADDYKEGRRDV